MTLCFHNNYTLIFRTDILLPFALNSKNFSLQNTLKKVNIRLLSSKVFLVLSSDIET